MGSSIAKLSGQEYCGKKISFTGRIFARLKEGWYFYAFFLIGISLLSTFINAICIVGFILAINFVQYYSQSKFHLTRISLVEGELKIEYLFRDEAKTVEDHRDRFFFEKKRLWYKTRGRLTYLVIRYDEKVLLKQFPLGNIDEALFDNLISNFS